MAMRHWLTCHSPPRPSGGPSCWRRCSYSCCHRSVFRSIGVYSSDCASGRLTAPDKYHFCREKVLTNTCRHRRHRRRLSRQRRGAHLLCHFCRACHLSVPPSPSRLCAMKRPFYLLGESFPNVQSCQPFFYLLNSILYVGKPILRNTAIMVGVEKATNSTALLYSSL